MTGRTSRGHAREADFEAMVCQASEPLMLSSGVLAPAALPRRPISEFVPRWQAPRDWEPCRHVDRPFRGGLFDYLGEERAVLLRTGWTGEILDGDPVLLAAVLRRRYPAQRYWRDALNFIAFLCPWSAQGEHTVHRHGYPMDGDCPELTHRQSHCADYTGGYFLRAFDPQLPRLPWQGIP